MNIFKKSLFELLVVILILLLVFFIGRFFSSDEENSVEITNVKIKEKILTLEIADDFDSRSKGLSERGFLEEDYGMIFVYSEEVPELTFWMKNTLIPLDMIFIDSNLEIVGIFQDVPICEQEPCPTYISNEKAQYVIEVNSGWVEKNNVEIGDGVEFIVLDQFAP